MKSAGFFVFVVCLAVLAPPSGAQIQLNEILADPASDWDSDGVLSSKSDEWVEIVNNSPFVVDLSCYRLVDLSGGTTWRYGFAGTLAPGSVFTVYGSDAVSWQSANGFPALGLSLNNAGDTVFLYDVSVGDTVVVDEYTYQSFETIDDRSVGRRADLPSEWVIFDALNPYGGTNSPFGNGCEPTPNGINSCGSPVPTHDTTWGAVKELFSNPM